MNIGSPVFGPGGQAPVPQNPLLQRFTGFNPQQTPPPMRPVDSGVEQQLLAAFQAQQAQAAQPRPVDQGFGPGGISEGATPATQAALQAAIAHIMGGGGPQRAGNVPPAVHAILNHPIVRALLAAHNAHSHDEQNGSLFFHPAPHPGHVKARAPRGY